jgi:Phosphoglucomutase
MAQHPHAGKPARVEDLTNIPRLVAAYYLNKPDMSLPEQRVAFGTSGHRGSSLHNAFTESHIQAVSQALAEYRQSKGITGPLVYWYGYARVVRSSTGQRRTSIGS